MLLSSFDEVSIRRVVGALGLYVGKDIIGDLLVAQGVIVEAELDE